MRKLMLVLFLLCASVFSGEALWPIHGLPLEEIEKDWGFKPDEKWVAHIQRATARVRMKGAPGGGSGAFVSPNGLLVTNRHVIDDVLEGLSNPERNINRDGFVARTRQDEIDSGIEICVLRRVMNVTDRVRADMKQNSVGFEQLKRQIENSVRDPKISLKVVSLFAGAEYWVYVYDVYPAKLVFVPEEALGAFGGEDDNFSFPRHKLDVAFLRAYSGGEALQSANFFSLGSKGLAENDKVFIAGNPGVTERYLPMSRIAYLRDHEMPLEVATGKIIFAAIDKYMSKGDEQRRNSAPFMAQYANVLKLKNGSMEYFKRPEFITARTSQEKEWREKIAASPEAVKAAGDAFKQIESACATLAKSAGTRHFKEMPEGRFWSLVRSLNSFSNASRNKPPAVLNRMTASFSEFLDAILNPKAPLTLELEREILTAWLRAAQERLPADHEFLKLALNGQPADDAARALLSGAEKLTQASAVKELISKGAASIDEAKLPVLKFIADLNALGGKELAEAEEAEKQYKDAIEQLERALAIAFGNKIAPDATGTLRLGWGVASGYEEAGKNIAWTTTFESMIARSADKNGKHPFVLSEKFNAGKAKLDLKTPLNFVSTADGCPGSSGSPMFTKDFNLVGIMFDGNQQEVPSIYSYIQPSTGGRSISVDCRAVLSALKSIYDANPILEELNAAAEGALKK